MKRFMIVVISLALVLTGLRLFIADGNGIVSVTESIETIKNIAESIPFETFQVPDIAVDLPLWLNWLNPVINGFNGLLTIIGEIVNFTLYLLKIQVAFVLWLFG